MTHVRFLLNSRIKKGYSLYSKLTDYYFTKEIKVLSTVVGKVALIVFYNVSLDFYYVAPFALNLIGGIQCICETSTPSATKIKKNFLHISTMIYDTFSLFNSSTRLISSDFNFYLGDNAILNQTCFSQIIRNSSQLAELYKEYLTRNFTLAKIAIEKRKIFPNKSVELPKKIKLSSSSYVLYMNKKKKGIKFRDYIGRPYQEVDPPVISTYQEVKNKFNSINPDKMTKDIKNKENVRLNFGLENLDKATAQFFSTSTAKAKGYNNDFSSKSEQIDLLGLGSYSAGDSKSVQNDSVKTNEFNLFKNNNKHKEGSTFELNLDFDTISSINQSVMLLNSQKSKANNDYLNKSSNNINHNPIVSTAPPKNEGIIDLNFIDFTKKPTQKNSQTINNYPQINQSFMSHQIPLPNNFNSMKPGFYSPNPQAKNQNLQSFNTFSASSSNFPGFNMNIGRSRSPMVNNQNSSVSSNNSSAFFTQDDMSFLDGETKYNSNKEDFIQLDKYNPQIICELKERIYILFDQKRNVSSIDSKGYIGFSLKQGFKIHKKPFSLMFLKDSWKNSLFQNKQIDSTTVQKITEMNYSIELVNKINQIKLITYSINNQALTANRALNGNFIWNNKILNVSISYTNIINIQNIYKTTIVIYPRTGMQCFVVNSNGGVCSVGNKGEISLNYVRGIYEAKIEMNGCNVIWKIGIRIELANAVVTGNDIKVSFNNSVNFQENLKISKLALVNYEYMF